MLDRPLSECVDRAIALLPYACRDAPASTEALVGWAARLSPTGRARDYFDGGRAVMFLLPWWLEKRIQPVPDVRFQELLVESTVSAYYFVRIVDNLMDEDAAEERACSRSSAFFTRTSPAPTRVSSLRTIRSGATSTGTGTAPRRPPSARRR